MQLFANNADSSLNGAIAADTLVLTLKTGEGTKFPSPSNGDYFLVTLYQKLGSGEINHEIVKCTSRAGDNLTVVRAQEGTSAKSFNSGDLVELRFTKGTAENFPQMESLDTKEPVIEAPGSAPTEKYWRGDKTWRDFFTDVRAATLAGLSTATNAVVAATDTVLAAIGKLQAQVSAKFDKTGGDISGNVNLPSLNGGQLAGFRNKIINGCGLIMQRGASVTITSSTGYTLDRFFANGSATISRQTSGSPAGLASHVRVQYPASTGVVCNIANALESFDVNTLKGQTVTASVYFRRSSGFAAGIRLLAQKNATADTQTGGSWSDITSVLVGNAELSTTTWARATITFSVPNDGSANGLRLLLAEDALSINASAFWEYSGLQLEVGSVATPFEHRPYGLELALCQRYYYRISSETTGATTSGSHAGRAFSSTGTVADFRFPVQMRVAPTALEQSGVAGQYAVDYAATTVSCSMVPSFDLGTTINSLINFSVASGLTTGHSVNCRISGGYLGWSAEL